MAEAGPTSQASSLNIISSETLTNTLAQVSSGVTEEEHVQNGITGTALNTVNDSEASHVNNGSISDILKSLNGIANRFDFLEQQARVDREKVNRLCEQFQQEHVNKKGKSSKKVVNKTVVSDLSLPGGEDISAFSYAGARPKVQGRRVDERQQHPDNLLSYERFLALHQDRSGRSTHREEEVDPVDHQPSVAGGHSSNANLSVFRSRDASATEKAVAGRSGQRGFTGDVRLPRGHVEEQDDVERDRDEHFPPLQTLNNTASIQRQVQERYRELETANESSKGTLDNILEYFVKNSEKKAKDPAKGMWPQDHVFVGTHRRKPTYDDLDECQWLLGFLRQRQIAKSSVVRENMIEYLIDLLQDAVDFSWPAAKGAHFVVTHRIIDGLATWENLDSVQKIRERFAKSNGNQSGNGNVGNTHKQGPAKLKHVPCFKYNRKGGCTESGDHVYNHLLLKHACQVCYQITGNFENHAQKSCPRNLHQNKPKNV